MSRQVDEISEDTGQPPCKPAGSCQLKSMSAIKSRMSLLDNIMQYRVNILRPAKRTAIFLRNSLANLLNPKRAGAEKFPAGNGALMAGDTVRVLKKEEIRQMLDAHEKYKGCLFIDEMYEYCDREFVVLKDVEYFFDEAKNRMCRCRNIYALKGVTCSGRQRLYQVSCDRSCFFFWHRHWLKKA